MFFLKKIARKGLNSGDLYAYICVTWGGVLFLTQAWVLLKWKFTQVHI